MKKMKRLLSLGLAFTALFLQSCNTDDDIQPTPQPEGAFDRGVFILNEGNFGSGNSSVSFLSSDAVMTQNIYNAVNGMQLGDVAQSIYTDGDMAYIVVNGSSKIEIVNRNTFEKVGTVSNGLMNPRYITITNGRGYVTNWGNPSDPNDDFVAVINLSNFTVSSTIPVAEGPEQLVYADSQLFVAHMGGWGYGNTVSVISTTNNTVVDSIAVGFVPESIVVSDDMLFVLSSGKAAWTGEETIGSLSKFDIHSHSMLLTKEFEMGFHPENLTLSDDILYFTANEKVYKSGYSFSDLTELFSMTAQGVFGAYGFAVRNGLIYVGDAGDYTSDGTVHIYKTSGDLVNSYTVGPLPNGFGFND